ncbi:MAG: S8 family serine peptidase [bacterium]|nr:S8 family serine peptidase [bacterium]
MKYKTPAVLCSCLLGTLLLFGGQANSQQAARLQNSEVVVAEMLEPKDGSPVLDQIGETNFYETTIATARKLDDVKAIHPNLSYRPTLVTNDPFEPQSYLTLIDAEDAWNISTGSDTVVAVIDSGFALAHEDLSGRWYVNPSESGALASNGLDDDANGFIDDWRGWDFAQNDNNPSAGTTNTNGAAVGHGTAVAGMIGATGNNAIGVASLDWTAKLMPLQIFSDDGAATTAELAEAMDYAINNGAEVINLSLGSTASDAVIDSLIADAEAAGIVVVVAAGNCGDTDYALEGCNYQGQTLYPATNPTTVAVAATTLTDTRASFSSYGIYVDLAAPGSGSISTTLYDPADPTGAYSGSIYGTSFAAPLTTGLVALLKDEWLVADVKDIQAVLVDSAHKTGEMNGSTYTQYVGFGRVRPLEALQRAQACAATVLSANINCSGTVDLLDLSILASQWQMDRTGRSDINKSGKTELLDLSVLASKWGQ